MRTFSPALVIALLSLPTGGCGETQSESVRRVLDAGLNDGARDGAPDDVTLRLPVDSAVPDATEEPEVSTTAVVFDGSCPDAADAHGALADAGSFTSCDDNPCGSGQFCLNLTLNSGEQIGAICAEIPESCICDATCACVGTSWTGSSPTQTGPIPDTGMCGIMACAVLDNHLVMSCEQVSPK